VWVGVKDDAEMLVELAGRLEERLEPVGARKEARKFAPHLTIGRVRGTRGAGRLLDKISKNREFEGGTQTVGQLTFMSSDLTSSGPVYSPIERIYLGR
jgi:2'-5' RNA ligase